MISVIIPVYNVEKYLKKCIDSIINQTYTDLEIILVDDGSTDSSGQICEEYEKSDERIKVFHTQNGGLSAARNYGMSKAQGEYISFVDSDDWLELNMFETLMKNLSDTDSDVSICGLYHVKGEKLINKSTCDSMVVFDGQDVIKGLICEQISNSACYKLYRRECWNEYSFPVGRLYEEIATIHKVILRAKRVVYDPTCMYYYRKREGSISKTHSMRNLEEYWKSSFDRSRDLQVFPFVREDKHLKIKLEDRVARASARVWWWIYKIPKAERNMDFVNNVSQYVRENYPVFGYRGWKANVRITLFLVRHVNETSFRIGYFLCSLGRKKG